MQKAAQPGNTIAQFSMDDTPTFYVLASQKYTSYSNGTSDKDWLVAEPLHYSLTKNYSLLTRDRDDIRRLARAYVIIRYRFCNRSVITLSCVIICPCVTRSHKVRYVRNTVTLRELYIDRYCIGSKVFHSTISRQPRNYRLSSLGIPAYFLQRYYQSSVVRPSQRAACTCGEAARRRGSSKTCT